MTTKITDADRALAEELVGPLSPLSDSWLIDLHKAKTQTVVFKLAHHREESVRELVDALRELLSAEKLDDGDPILDKARTKAALIIEEYKSP